MTQEEIKSKIADLEKRAKNPSIPASLVTVINQSIANLKSQLKEEAKEEPKKKAEPKATKEPKAKVEKPKADKKEEPKKSETKMSDDEYCRQLIKEAKERQEKAKQRAKERANEPKKTPATKNKEAVERTTERVATNVEKRAEKGKVNAQEIEKLIKEYEDAIKKLRAVLAKIKSGKKMEWGGTADSSSDDAPMIGGTMESSLEYAKGGKVKPAKKKKRLSAREIIDSKYSALKAGARKSAKVAYVEMKGGTGYYRKNANQYVKAGKAGGRTYTEYRREHSDVKKYL